MTTSIAIITARGGSKRIPRKNIKSFLGKPIIAYGIEAALKSKIFKDVIVSTDDDEIANVAIKFGATVPFRRSDQSSNDQATTDDVLNETFSVLQKMGKSYDYACCIYPTAVFTDAETIKSAYQMLLREETDFVFPYTKFSYPVEQTFKVDERGYITQINEKQGGVFHDAGQFYFFEVPGFIKRKTLMSDLTKGIFLDESQVHDINDPEDWTIAEKKFLNLKK